MIPSSRLITSGAVVMLSVRVLLVASGLTPVVAGSPLAQQQPAPAPSASAAAPAATPTPLSLETLTQIQPGLSTYMMETAQRFGIMWFAAKHQNWDFAAFEAREAKEVLQHGAVRSNQSRQQGINAYNSGYLDPLIAAAQSGDQAQFESAYTSAIDGCNACHSSQNYGKSIGPSASSNSRCRQTRLTTCTPTLQPRHDPSKAFVAPRALHPRRAWPTASRNSGGLWYARQVE